MSQDTAKPTKEVVTMKDSSNCSTDILQAWPQSYKKFLPYSTQSCMQFILLINTMILTTVGNLIAISRLNPKISC